MSKFVILLFIAFIVNVYGVTQKEFTIGKELKGSTVTNFKIVDESVFAVTDTLIYKFNGTVFEPFTDYNGKDNVVLFTDEGNLISCPANQYAGSTKFYHKKDATGLAFYAAHKAGVRDRTKVNRIMGVRSWVMNRKYISHIDGHKMVCVSNTPDLTTPSGIIWLPVNAGGKELDVQYFNGKWKSVLKETFSGYLAIHSSDGNILKRVTNEKWGEKLWRVDNISVLNDSLNRLQFYDTRWALNSKNYVLENGTLEETPAKEDFITIAFTTSNEKYRITRSGVLTQIKKGQEKKFSLGINSVNQKNTAIVEQGDLLWIASRSIEKSGAVKASTTVTSFNRNTGEIIKHFDKNLPGVMYVTKQGTNIHFITYRGTEMFVGTSEAGKWSLKKLVVPTKGFFNAFCAVDKDNLVWILAKKGLFTINKGNDKEKAALVLKGKYINFEIDSNNNKWLVTNEKVILIK